MNYVIAIPSYKRSEILKNKTLQTLQKYSIDPNKIFIFVADQCELEVYKSAIPRTFYNQIVIAELGLHKARNFINSFFPRGQYIVEIDDDVSGFIEFDSTAYRSEKPLESLESVIHRGFQEAVAQNAGLWGVYPSANGYFMRNSVTTDLRHILGAFWGQINPGDQISISLESKEDYERTLLFYLRDKKVVRLNFVAPKTSVYKTPGGLQATRTKEKIEKEVDYLLQTFPDYVIRNPRRKTGFPEIKLRRSV